jgi:hypothetical protein
MCGTLTAPLVTFLHGMIRMVFITIAAGMKQMAALTMAMTMQIGARLHKKPVVSAAEGITNKVNPTSINPSKWRMWHGFEKEISCCIVVPPTTKTIHR